MRRRLGLEDPGNPDFGVAHAFDEGESGLLFVGDLVAPLDFDEKSMLASEDKEIWVSPACVARA